MKRRGVRIVMSVLLTAAVAASIATTPQAESQRDTPALLVVVAVDQFRADYREWYGDQWRGGLHRLFSEGAVFPRATIPWAVTKTCAGHASISTGAVPARHGLIANEWFDRASGTLIECTTDPSAQPIGFAGRRGVEHHSPRHLLVPTLAEELRRQAAVPPRTVVVALKARSAIALAGRGGDSTIVVWEEESGTWATSTAFASRPWPEVDTYIAAHRPDDARGATWNRARPIAHYQHEDRAPGEPAGGVLPRRLIPPFGVPFSAVWDASPFSDAYIADLAIDLAERTRLGQRQATDLLVVGFPALDYVGHSFGPRSHEVQDTLLHLDENLGRLIEALDRAVGRDRYVLGFTSDHGVGLLPEQAAAVTGTPGGRLDPGAVATAVDRVLRDALGRHRVIEAVTGVDIHLSQAALDRIRHDPGLAIAVAAAAGAVPGVHRVFWRPDLAPADADDDPGREAFLASYVAGRSGDLTFLPAENWVVAGSGTHHGSLHAYDRDVPLVFFGAGIKPGRHNEGAPIDLAPTLADFAGITMPSAQGVSRRGLITK